MHSSPFGRPVEPPQARGRHRGRILTVTMLLSAALALILYRHGASWWYAPLLFPGVVLAHVAMLGGLVFIAARVTRAQGRQGTENSQQSGSSLLHRPRLFDFQVRLITLGRERKLREWMLNLADLEPGDLVLDVGCGTGTLLLAAAERVGPSGAVHGVEPSPEMAARARDKAEARGVPLDVVEGSAGSLPYPPGSFDVVFCTLVLHHLPESIREVAIREMRRVLRPGGRVVIIDWQRPKSLGGAISGGLSLISLLHSLRPGASASNVLDIEPVMKELGFEKVSQHAFGNDALRAVVGRLGSVA
jgi:ubiquinone/menaquinone biosynthesis C-methylase UbiE